jgi:hypothetical protein
MMSAKETAKQVIDSLAEDVTMDDILYTLQVNGKFSRGEREIREGKGVPHEEANRRLERSLNDKGRE